MFGKDFVKIFTDENKTLANRIPVYWKDIKKSGTRKEIAWASG